MYIFLFFLCWFYCIIVFCFQFIVFSVTIDMSLFFFFSSRRRHTRCLSDWSSDVCSSDLDIPFARDIAKERSQPAYLNDMRDLLKRHPNTTIIWAHTGLGRTVAPPQNHLAIIEAILRDPNFRHRSEERRVGKECRYRRTRS